MQPVLIGGEEIGLVDALNTLISKLDVLINRVEVVIPAYILLGVIFGVVLGFFMQFVIKIFSRGKL